jgi:hypothetical protein
MISLPVIPSTSPSLADAMRGCKLRAGLSRCAQLHPFVLGNPKAWLGTAYHKVMEQLPTILSSGNPLANADAVWNAEIASLEQEANAHPLNARFGPALTWKGYFLVQATMRLRIQEAIPGGSTAQPAAASPSAAREQEITGAQGKLRGKIDMIRGDDLIDYKTSSIYEDDEVGGAPAVKTAYVRQLRIYAWLAQANSSTGRWVNRGLLYPLAGAPVEVPIVPAECETEAAEAIALLDAYNAAVAGGKSLTEMATPAPDTCRWCPFKPFCPAFWAAVDPSWSGQLDGEAIRGIVAAPPQPLLAPGAYSLVVEVQAGTVAPGESVRLAPLPAQVHHAVTGLAPGQQVVLTRIGRRANGSLFPLLQTVLLTGGQIGSVTGVPP